MFSWSDWKGWLLGASAVAVWIKFRDTVLCSMKLWFCWLWSTLLSYILAPIEAVLDAIPDLPDSVFEFGELAYCLNRFVPLYEYFGYLAVYWTIYVAWLIVRLVKSFVPTVGN